MYHQADLSVGLTQCPITVTDAKALARGIMDGGGPWTLREGAFICLSCLSVSCYIVECNLEQNVTCMGYRGGFWIHNKMFSTVLYFFNH